METEPLPAPISQRTRLSCSCSLARVTARTSCLVMSFLTVANCSSSMPMTGYWVSCGSQVRMKMTMLRGAATISASPLTSVRVNLSAGSPRFSQSQTS